MGAASRIGGCPAPEAGERPQILVAATYGSSWRKNSHNTTINLPKGFVA